MNENDGKESPAAKIKSFMDNQRQGLGGLIEDQLGPSAQLAELISKNPFPLLDENNGVTEE
jgi:hypothetical protein